MLPTFHRRWFLKGSLGAAALASLPTIIPATAFGANERVVTGHIGLGGQGMSNLRPFIKQAAAICEVDTVRLGKAIAAVEKEGGKPTGFGDYRKLLERKDIDAVVISTPDHWHTLPALHAMQAGKDVYCEKPLTLTVAEGRKLVEVARAEKRILQTGSQQRSDAKFRLGCELVRNGKIGKLKQVLVGIPGPNHPGEPVPDSDPPKDLDYEMWLGPAPFRPYNSKRVHYNFRFFWDYSGGQMTNWGAHHIDIAQWGLGMDASGPVSVGGVATFHPKKWHDVTETCRITCTYANGVELIIGQGQKDIPGGTTFIGEDGTVFVNRGVIKTTPEELATKPGDLATKLYVSANHHRNFLDCVASRELPICDVEIGHRSATVCHLANHAVRLGRKLTWDPAAEKIIGDDEATKALERPYRKPWKLA